MSPKIVSFVNLKGGVGKTTLSVNFSAYCGTLHKKTLLIDLDPQTNATFSCITGQQWRDFSLSNGTIANLLGARRSSSAEDRQRKASDVVIKNVFQNVDLIPSHIDLFTIDLDLAAQTARESKLRRAVNEIQDEYEIIVCDCPPNLTIPTQNALAFSTNFVVPVSPDYLSSIGVALLLKRVQEFSEDIEHKIIHSGIVISRYGRESTHRAETVQALRNQFSDKVLSTIIKERDIVSKQTEKQESVFNSSNSEAIREFSQVSEEILQRIA